MIEAIPYVASALRRVGISPLRGAIIASTGPVVLFVIAIALAVLPR